VISSTIQHVLRSIAHLNLTMNHLNWINLMIFIIIKKLDHYQSTQFHHQLTFQRFYLFLDKICCEHVYLSQNDEILISHREIRKRDFVYKSRKFLVDKILNKIDSINTSNLRLRKSVLLLLNCLRIIILTVMSSIASTFWSQFSAAVDSSEDTIISS
jgi:hypothetical protein